MKSEPGKTDRLHREDDDSLRRFLAGEHSGFEEIVHRHQDRIFRLALALIGDFEDARDASQEVFLRAFRGLGRWRFESRLSTWLYRLTLNVCHEFRRRRMREIRKHDRWLRLVAPLGRRDMEPSQALTDGPLGLLVERLPDRQKEVVVLRVFHELSVAETAFALGIPEGTVKSNFFKAMSSLRSKLDRSTQSPSKGNEK